MQHKGSAAGLEKQPIGDLTMSEIGAIVVAPHAVAVALSQWFRLSARALPWRETTDPYKIWVSEIILQQTRVEQGLGYYMRFLGAFPTMEALADADENDVMRLWQGLGYYSRARNLHRAAKMMVEKGGGFPSSFKAIRELPGVGDYTAGAVASFAFGLPYPAVDGNVMRVLSRLLASTQPIDSKEGKKLLTYAADELVKVGEPAIINQALMELGATCCLPKKPQCPDCPISPFCKVAGLPEALTLPIKEKKTAIRDRYLYFIWISDGTGRVPIRKRTGKDIWKSLYELPLTESDKPLSEKELRKRIQAQWSEVVADALTDFRHETLHILTHQRLHITFLRSEPITPLFRKTRQQGEAFSTPWEGFLAVKREELDHYGLPAAIFKHLEKLF